MAKPANMAPAKQAVPLTPALLVRQRLPVILKALPGKESAVKRFTQAAISISGSKGISECRPETVLKAIYACARLNLIPDPVLKQVYIVPFRDSRGGGKVATIVIAYPGLIMLARRAAPSLSLQVGSVWKDDDYVLEEGIVPVFRIKKRWWEKGHAPPNRKGDTKDLVFTYCVSRRQGAEPELTIVPAQEILALAHKAKSGFEPGKIWFDWYVEMGEKTAIRRASRTWELDPEKEETRRFREALEIDERSDEGGDLPDIDNSGVDLFAGDLDEGKRGFGHAADKGPPDQAQPEQAPPAAGKAEPPEAKGRRDRTQPAAGGIAGQRTATEPPPAEAREPEEQAAAQGTPQKLKDGDPATVEDTRAWMLMLDMRIAKECGGEFATIQNREKLSYVVTQKTPLELVVLTHGDMANWRTVLRDFPAEEIRKACGKEEPPGK